MTETVITKDRVTIRLTDERWAHISEEHNELAGLRLEVLETVANPWRILAGNAGEKLAIREIESAKFMVAVYRETGPDGFIITAFITRRINSLNKRKQLWP